MKSSDRNFGSVHNTEGLVKSPRTNMGPAKACSCLKFLSSLRRTLAATSVGILLMLMIMPPVPAQQLPPAPTFTILHSFTGPPNDGRNPITGLTLDSAGNLYGTTGIGGTANWGTVFVVRPDGSEAVLYNFPQTAFCCPGPSGLTLGSDGNFYGTTADGGAAFLGTVFSMSPAGTLTTIYSFAGSPNDGSGPVAGVIRDAAGDLYGTTVQGGVSGTGCSGTCGTVFKVSGNGVETVLHNFAGGSSDGGNPHGGLIQDSAGNLYGTASNGGSTGNGVVFEVAPDGTETVLYSFLGPANDGGPSSGAPNDGAHPQSGLVQDSAGNLYGTTLNGGAYSGGTVFKLSPAGSETLLHSFGGPSTLEGGSPFASVIMDAAGNLYGTTGSVGRSGGGPSVYELSPDGTFTVLHGFASSEGSPPSYGALVQDRARNLYGTTFGEPASPCSVEGPGGCGVVYKVVPPSADLDIANNAPSVALSGSTLTYSITVTNNGPDAASNVNIQDAIPAGTNFNSVATSSGSCTAPAPGGTGTVNCTAPGLALGSAITETLTVNVTAGLLSTITDTATVSSMTFDPTNNTSATATTTVVAAPSIGGLTGSIGFGKGKRTLY